MLGIRSDRSLVRVELARLEGTVSALVSGTSAQLADHESRIRRQERWMYALPLTAVASLLTSVTAALVAFIGH